MRALDRPFYAWAGAAAAAITFGGFAKTYYLKGWFPAAELPSLVHVHGIVMTLWVLFFIAQVALVAKGRVDVHRRLGIAGALLAVLVVVMGILTAIDAARRGMPVGPPPLVFMAITMSVVVVFGVFVASALYFRKRSDYHKRLMVLATLTMLTPAVARIAIDTTGIFHPLFFFALTDLLVIGFVAWDTARNRRLHPAFGWGLLFFLLSQPARFVLAGSGLWLGFAKSLVAG